MGLTDWVCMYSNTLLATAQNVILKPLAWSGVRILVSWNRKSDADQASRCNVMAVANNVLLYILSQSIPLEREPWSRGWSARPVLKSISLLLYDQGEFVRGLLCVVKYILMMPTNYISIGLSNLIEYLNKKDVGRELSQSNKSYLYHNKNHFMKKHSFMSGRLSKPFSPFHHCGSPLFFLLSTIWFLWYAADPISALKKNP